MRDSDDIRKYTTADIATERERGQTLTRADAPARPVDDDFWRNARVVLQPSREP